MKKFLILCLALIVIMTAFSSCKKEDFSGEIIRGCLYVAVPMVIKLPPMIAASR